MNGVANKGALPLGGAGIEFPSEEKLNKKERAPGRRGGRALETVLKL